MGSLENELSQLKSSLVMLNSSYSTIDQSLKLKFREIRKLDGLEKDLGKLKRLSELPQLFKTAILNHEKNGATDVDMNYFDEPINYY